MVTQINLPNIDIDSFYKIIDNIHDEVMVFDNNYTLIYLNKAGYRHYGISPTELIGKNFWELTNDHFWTPSTLPIVYDTKKVVAQKQKTILGSNIITISVPILDDSGNVEYVAMCVNDLNSINELYENLSNSPLEIEENNKGISVKIIYDSKEMKEIMTLAKNIARSKAPCLITGETGIGKNLLSKFIHQQSDRHDKPFITINCASISPSLIESELFGYTKGAFTGAGKDGKKGLIELADGGTLFLDEISEIPYSLQSKFLQVIQDGEFIAVGGQKTIKIDIRVIAATNCDLEQMIEVGTFRKDLFYRLNVFEIEIPPLRSRTSDIIKLVYYYLNLYNNLYERNHSLSDQALKILTDYSWPGNIRELSHIMEKITAITLDTVIKPEHLPKKLYELENKKYSIDTNCKSLDMFMENMEKQVIARTYAKYPNSIRVAKELGISQSRAYRLIKKYVL